MQVRIIRVEKLANDQILLNMLADWEADLQAYGLEVERVEHWLTWEPIYRNEDGELWSLSNGPTVPRIDVGFYLACGLRLATVVIESDLTSNFEHIWLVDGNGLNEKVKCGRWQTCLKKVRQMIDKT